MRRKIADNSPNEWPDVALYLRETSGIFTLKSQVVLLQTAHSWVNAGDLLGARMHRERKSIRNH